MAFTEETLSFLMENHIMDSREWFHKHKAEYEEYVVRPMAELYALIAPAMLKIDPEFICIPQVGKSISRLWRDTRMQKADLPVYRESIWGSFIREKYRGYPSYWFAVSPGGVEWGMGWYQAGNETMKALREKVLADDPEWLAADEAYRKQKRLRIGGETNKKSPFTAQPENKRLWLDQRNIYLESGLLPSLTFSDDLHKRIIRDFRAVAPVYRYFVNSTVRWEW